MYCEKHAQRELSKECLNQYKILLKDELSQIPGNSPRQRLDRLYLYYRNGIHHADNSRNDITGPEYAPIQCKTLFTLKSMLFPQFKLEKLAFDLVQTLNPVVAALPYSSVLYNDFKKNHKNLIYHEDKRFHNLHISGNADTKAYENAKVIKRQNEILIEPEDKIKYAAIDGGYIQMRGALKYILTYKDGLLRFIGDILFYYTKEDAFAQQNAKTQKVLHNKIMSLYYILKILEG